MSAEREGQIATPLTDGMSGSAFELRIRITVSSSSLESFKRGQMEHVRNGLDIILPTDLIAHILPTLVFFRTTRKD